MAARQNVLRRMSTAFTESFEDQHPLHGPARVAWAICTFGYPYPRRRVGENATVCTFRTFVVLIARFACIMGSLWYIHNLAEYVMLGKARPYNILSIENDTVNVTIAPGLNIFNWNANAVQLSSMSYHDNSGDYPLEPQLDDHPDLLVIGSGVDTLSAYDGAYTQYILKHNAAFASNWTRVGLIHPNSSTVRTDSRDVANQYYFYPGHIVEIRFAPLEFHTVNRVDKTSSAFARFKDFFGFAGETTGFSYKSSVTHMPFPPTRPATWDNLTTVLIIRPESFIGIVSYNEEKTSFRATMSDIGGLIGIVGSILAFLFGVSLMSPWGFIAGIPYFRRRITGSLAEAYTSQGGLSKGPFTTHQSNIGQFEPDMSTEVRIAMVKEQLDELELVLMEYYIDGAVFQDYDKERTRVKIRRAASTRSRVNGIESPVGGDVEGGFGNGKSRYSRGNPNMELSTLPSRTLYESQHQHQGQLPSPEHPPVHPRRVSLDRHHRRTSSSTEAGGVFDYYQQQKLQQYQQQSNNNNNSNSNNNSGFRNSTLSDHGLLHNLTEDPISPTRTGRGRRSSQLNDRTHFAMDAYDQDYHQTQQMGLLQQDHHSMRQSYLHNNSTTAAAGAGGMSPRAPGSPAYPPRPPKDDLVSMHLRNESDHTLFGNDNIGYYGNIGVASAPTHAITAAIATSTATATSTSTTSSPPPVNSFGFSTGHPSATTAGPRPFSVLPLNPTRASGSEVSGGGGVDLSNLSREF